jgi:hypothetical protein
MWSVLLPNRWHRPYKNQQHGTAHAFHRLGVALNLMPWLPCYGLWIAVYRMSAHSAEDENMLVKLKCDAIVFINTGLPNIWMVDHFAGFYARMSNILTKQ